MKQIRLVRQRHGIKDPRGSPVPGEWSHGDGWAEVVDNMLDELEEAGWNNAVWPLRIEEKNGQLDVQVAGWESPPLPPGCAEIIDRLEDESVEYCVFCGARGADEWLDDRRWPLTLCRTCGEAAGYTWSSHWFSPGKPRPDHSDRPVVGELPLRDNARQ